MKDINSNEHLISSIEITNNFVGYLKTQFLYGVNVLKIFSNFLQKNNQLNFKLLNSELKYLKKLFKKLNKYLLALHTDDLKINKKLALSFQKLVENYLSLFYELQEVFKSRDSFDKWLINNTNCIASFEKDNTSKKIQEKKINFLFWRGQKLLKRFQFDIQNISLKLEAIQKFLQEN